MTWDILETREKVPKKISAPTISREGSEKNLRTYDSRSHLQKDSFWHIISGTSGAQTSTARARARGAHCSSKKKSILWQRNTSSVALTQLPMPKRSRHVADVSATTSAVLSMQQRTSASAPAPALAPAPAPAYVSVSASASASLCQCQCQHHRQRQRYLQPQCQRHLQCLCRHIHQQLMQFVLHRDHWCKLERNLKP